MEPRPQPCRFPAAETNIERFASFVESLPVDATAQRWADAVRLAAELGLRPIELLRLSVRQDPATGERYWWCSSRKRSSGGATLPRRLEPLPLIAKDGTVQQWHLLERWQKKVIQLPPLESGNGAADLFLCCAMPQLSLGLGGRRSGGISPGQGAGGQGVLKRCSENVQ